MNTGVFQHVSKEVKEIIDTIKIINGCLTEEKLSYHENSRMIIIQPQDLKKEKNDIEAALNKFQTLNHAYADDEKDEVKPGRILVYYVYDTEADNKFAYHPELHDEIIKDWMQRKILTHLGLSAYDYVRLTGNIHTFLEKNKQVIASQSLDLPPSIINLKDFTVAKPQLAARK